MTQDIRIETFANGLVLVLEPMANVQSAAFSLLVPAGSAYEPAGRNGTAAVLCDLSTRGAGPRDSRELSDALDDLGVQRHETVGTYHLTYTGATLARNLLEALGLYADIVRRPHLPEDEFESVVDGVELSLRALEDDPSQKVLPELKRRCYDDPLGRPTDGTLEELPAIDPDAVRSLFATGFRPQGAILGVAGRIDPEAVVAEVGRLLGDWTGPAEPPLAVVPAPGGIVHIPHESAQTHLGVAWPSVPYRDPGYYDAWAGVGVLSAGGSSRLWVEVREKRGLCYAVSAAHHSLRDRACVLCYAGTERPDETLDVMLREVRRLEEGFGADELDRCRTIAKTSLVMQQESTVSRSSSIARDWFHLGRVVPLDEVCRKVDALTVESVLAAVRARPARDFTVLSIGPQPPEMPRDLP